MPAKQIPANEEFLTDHESESESQDHSFCKYVWPRLVLAVHVVAFAVMIAILL